MADIFGGTQPPAWLGDLTKQNEAKFAQIGQMAGTHLGAGLLALTQPDEDKPVNPETGERPKVSFDKAYKLALLNQQDPFWELKAQKAKNEILLTGSQVTAMNALGKQREEELKAWMLDAPAVSTWAAYTPEVREAKQAQGLAPTAHSQKGMTTMGQISQADERYRIARDNSKAQIAKDALYTEFEQGKLDMDDATGHAYDDLVKNGEAYEMLPNGTYSKYPSQKAINLLNKGRIALGKIPIGASAAYQKDFERIQRAKDRSELEKQKIEGRIKVAELQGDIQWELQDERYDRMLELEKAKQNDKEKAIRLKIELTDKAWKEHREIINKQRDKENSIYYKEPVSYPQPDGSVVITFGKQMRVIEPKNDEDKLLIKSQLKEIDKEIETLQKLSLAQPNNAEVAGRLIDAHLKRINLFHARSHALNAKQASALKNPPPPPAPAAGEGPDESNAPAGQTMPNESSQGFYGEFDQNTNAPAAAAPAAPKVRKYNPQTGKIE